LKRIPGIKPRFTRCTIHRPDGSVLPAWEMFVGERSYGRSDSKTALLRSWEARLEEAENGRPFAFRPMQRRGQMAGRTPARRPDSIEATSRGPHPVPQAVPRQEAKSSGRRAR
jgi:hypothetical protein